MFALAMAFHARTVSAFLLATKSVINDAAQRRTLTKPNVWGPTLNVRVLLTATTPTKRRIPSLSSKENIATRSRIKSLFVMEPTCWYRQQAIETKHNGIPHMKTAIRSQNTDGRLLGSLVFFSGTARIDLNLTLLL